MKRIPLLALAVPVAFGACTMKKETPDENVQPGQTARSVSDSDQKALTEASGSQAPGTGTYQDPAPDSVTPVPNPGAGQTAVGSLRPVNNSGINGSLTVAAVGQGTLVSVSLTRAPANAVYQVALHQGKCGQVGGQVAAFKRPLQVDANGIGAGSDTLTVAPAAAMNGRNVLVLKGQNAGPATPPVACADIPAH